MNHYQLQPWRNGEFVITVPHPSGDSNRRAILRLGHDVDINGVGIGSMMRWKSETAVQMYCDLLNKKAN